MSTQKINTVAHNSEFIGICSAITLPSIRSVLTCAVISPSLLPAPSTNEHDDVFAGRRQPALHAGSHLPIIHCAFSLPSPLSCLNEYWLLQPPLPFLFTLSRLFMKLQNQKWSGRIWHGWFNILQNCCLWVFHISHNCITYPVSPAWNLGDTVNIPLLLHLCGHRVLSISPQKRLLHSSSPLHARCLCHGSDQRLSTFFISWHT